MQIIERNFIILLLVLGISCATKVAVNAQSFILNKTVDNTTPYPGAIFNYIINASCNSSTQDCESAIITDVLPANLDFVSYSQPLPAGVSSLGYDAATHSISFTFDATACPSCSPDGINTDEDDFAQGSTVQLILQVRFPFETFSGTAATNTVTGTSDNAGDPTSAAPVATSTGGTPPLTDCEQLYTRHSSTSEMDLTDDYWMSVRVVNAGLSDIENWMSVTYFPSEVNFTRFKTPQVDDKNKIGSIYYERSDMLGSWIHWMDFNFNDTQTIYESALGLPSGVEVTAIRMDAGTLDGNGCWNPYNNDLLWSGTLRMYFDLDSSVMNGDIIHSCTDFSGTIDGVNCLLDDCADTEINSDSPLISAGKSVRNMSGNYQFAHEQGDQLIFRINFSSPSGNSDPILGAVIVDILPVGMTYVSHSFASGQANIQNEAPVVELETLPDGRQLVRYIWDDSLNNDFVLALSSSFNIDMVVQIDPYMTPGSDTNDLYYSATGSDHDCLNGSQTADTEDYFNGYSYDGIRCSAKEYFAILYIPPPAGIDAVKESIGTNDAQYSSFPDQGTTVPGGISNYKITLTNPNATPIDDIIVIDIFPYVGDTEVLNNSVARNSEWSPLLVSPIIAPAGTTVYYSTVNNPCRDELASPSDPTPFPSGCTNAGWTSTTPANLSTVTAIKLDLGSTVLNQGDTWELIWEMRAPLNGVVNSTAWNSFGFIGTNADIDEPLLPSEPLKVGVEMNASSGPSIGNFVWEDLNKDGLQDGGEPGVDGVRVNLYEDSNNNGIAEPGVDNLYTYTLTSIGGQYLFTDFPIGDYFLEFLDYPSGYNPTYSYIGNDVTIDSEATVTDIFTVTNATDDLDFDFGLVDEILPPLIDISGSVYEDLNYGGGDGRDYTEADNSAQASGWAADEIGVENATVELYDNSGNFISSTLSDVNGDYTFADNPDATYQIRVVNSTVQSNRGSNSTGNTIIAVQTFRTDGVTDIINEVGGSNPALIDSGINTSGANLSTLTTSSTETQSVTVVVPNGASATGVDFGYNFDTVVNTNDSGQGSLRQFLENNNELNNNKLDQEDNPTNGVSFPKDPEWETSIFMIPGSGVHTIQPTSELENIEDPKTHLTAYTQAGSAQGPITSRTINVEIVGNTTLFEGIQIYSSDVYVSGLAITDFRNSIYSHLNNSTNNFIWGNYIGTAADGITIASSYSGTGIYLYNVNDSYIGTNGDNVNDANEGNLVSNSYDGISLRSTSGVLIAGNFVGIDRTGTVNLGNRYKGIYLRDPDGPNVIGFDDNRPNTNGAHFRNVSSGNGNDGIRILSGDNQVVAGNYFGTDHTGTVAIKNINYGIQIQGDVNNLIVGTDSDGDDDIKERNLMSGNGTGMRFVVGTTGTNNRVSGNFIGTDVTGNASLQNDVNGFEINGPISGVVVGTNADGVRDDIEGNVISGNDDDGIRLSDTYNNIIAGNNIGVGYDNTTPVPNGKRGIFIVTGAADNIIGYSPTMVNSDELIVGNDIKYNVDSGIAMGGTGIGNRISRNQTDSNGQLAIDIDYDGVTPNDNGDTDSGTNDWFNFPVLEYAQIVGSELHICGFAPPGSEIEFFITDGGTTPNPLPSSYTTSFGEGAVWLFTAFENGPLDFDNTVDSYTNDGTGAIFTRTQNRILIKKSIAGLNLTQGIEITATATNAGNSTSEFSGWTKMEIREICDDGIDNDMDGLTDCEDTDCMFIIADTGPIITFCDGLDATIQATVDSETLAASIESCEDPSSSSSSSSGGIGYTISWSGPNGFNSSVINPTVTESGTYTLTITDDNNCETTAQAEVIVFDCDNTSDCYLKDEFNSMSYFGSDGSQPWTAFGWDESGDNNSSSSGDIMIFGGELLMENSNSDKSIARSVDLTGQSSAILSFDFRTEGALDADDIFTVEVFDGTSWITVFNYNSSSPGNVMPWLDISSYIASNSAIRFNIDGFQDSGERLLLDNIRIDVDCLCEGIADAGADMATCIGSTVQLNGAGGVSYEWSPAADLSNPLSANPTVTPVATTVYSLTVTDDVGCTDVAEVEITVNDLPTVMADDVSFCQGDILTLNATASGTAPMTYAWTPIADLNDPTLEDPEANPSGTTDYMVVATDGNGCENSATAIVTQIDTTVVFCQRYRVRDEDNVWGAWTPMTDCTIEICELNGLQDIQFDGGPNINTGWVWTDEDGNVDSEVDEIVVFANIGLNDSGTYTGVLTNAVGCPSRVSFEVIVHENVSSTAVEATHDYCLDGSGEATVTINDGVGPFEINWQNTDGEEVGSTTLEDIGDYTIQDLNGGTTYCISVTDSNGCEVILP